MSKWKAESPYSKEQIESSLSENLKDKELKDKTYGPLAGQNFDFWKAPAAGPRPLIIYIHGGGFNSGEKEGLNQDDLKLFLSKGISLASINYRLMNQTTLDHILRDTARAVQYFRYRSDDLGIDKNKIVCYGDSAGAGSSLWLAYHDDLKDLDNQDPIKRQSSSIIAAGAIATQATYDFHLWPRILGLPKVLIRLGQKSFFKSFMDWHIDLLGMGYFESLHDEKGKALRRDLDITSHIHSQAPPVVLYSTGKNSLKEILHNPKHARYVQRICKKRGAPCLLLRKRGEKSLYHRFTGFLIEQLLSK